MAKHKVKVAEGDLSIEQSPMNGPNPEFVPMELPQVAEGDLSIEQPAMVDGQPVRADGGYGSPEASESVPMELPEVDEVDKNFEDAVIGVDPAEVGGDETVVEYENLVFDNRHVKLAVGLVLRGSHDDMVIETNDGITLCSISAPARTFPAFV